MPKQAERIFLALTVDELSLVDEPANEKDIIVAKRKEQEMTTPAAAQTSATDPVTTTPVVETEPSIEVVQTEVDDSTSDEVVDLLKNLVANAAKIAKGGHTNKTDGKAKKAGDKLPPFLKAMEEKLKKAGVAKTDIDKAVTAAKAAFGASGLATEEPVAKNADGNVEPVVAAPAPAIDADELIVQTLETINKAKSFTPGRIKKLVEAIGTLDALLEELNIDKASFGVTGLTSTPTAATPSPPIMDTAASGGAGMPRNTIAKAVDGAQPTGLTAEGIAAAIAKALEPTSKSLSDLSGRLESIEKSRSPSTQPGGTDGDGNETTTQKSKGLWADVV